jgi:CTP synthase
MAVIEFARNVCNLTNATSTEIDEKTEHPVVINMPEISKTVLGGTMRLGVRPTLFMPGSENSKIRILYDKKDVIHERHRHRYEVNPLYVDQLEKAGLKFVGKDEKKERMIILELEGKIFLMLDHPYFVATQFHPEFKTRPLVPSPPFTGFILAAIGGLEDHLKELNLQMPPKLGRYPSVKTILKKK